MEDKMIKPGGFPIEVFPPLIQRVIRETNMAFNYPVQYTAASILSALSTAIGTSCSLRVKKDWIERAVFYIAIVGNPGSGKSHPIRFAMNPIIQRDIKARNEYEEKLNEYRKCLQSSNQNETMEKPRCRQRIVQDTTLEGLLLVLKNNPLGVCFYCDEMAVWLGSMDKYRKGGDCGVWLSFFNCTPVFIDRKSTDEKSAIETPFVNVIGSIQPSLLKKYLLGTNMENGLLSRMMVIYGDENEEMPYDSDLEISDDLKEKYVELIVQLLDYSEVSNDLCEVEYDLSEEAKSAYSSWSRSTTDRVNRSDPIIMREFFQKIKNYVFRFSLVLQITYEACEKRKSYLLIEEEIMKKACIFGDYLMDSARHTVSFFVKEDTISKTYRDIHAKLPATNFKKSDVNKVVADLGLSESMADKFCKDMQGFLIQKVQRGEYKKV